MRRIGTLLVPALLGGSVAASAAAALSPASGPDRVPTQAAGTDTIPPTLLSGRVLFDPLDAEETSVLEFVFSEPVEWFGAILYSNYIDVNTGQIADQGAWFPPDRTQVTFSPYQWGFGTCEQVRIINVKDLAGNTIVDDGIGNVFTFHLQQVHWRGRMRVHMADHDTPPHSFAVEGDTYPLSWTPNCDIALADADGDSIWSARAFFALPCSSAAGGPETADVEWKFSHQCSELEPLGGNRITTLDLATHPDGHDTLDVWWNDDAPANFTAQDMDVIFRVRAGAFAPPFAAGDSLGVIGSEGPLSWDLPPLVRILDDGIAPDDVANDGVYCGRSTFPADTYRDLLFRFVQRAAGDSVFRPECDGSPSRTIHLDDAQYPPGTPLDLDLVFDDCLNATAGPARPGRGLLRPVLSAVRPNPAPGEATVALSLPTRSHATLTVLDVRGRVVRRLVDRALEAGEHRVVWDGRTDRGQRAAAGVYFLRGVFAGRAETRRIVRTS